MGTRHGVGIGTGIATRPLSLRDVTELFGVTRQTVNAWIRAGRFPKPLAIGKGKLWFSAVEIEQALLGQIGTEKND